MGLDVYLYYYTDFEKSQQLEADYEERSNAIYAEYGKYDDLPEAQKKEARDRCDQLGKELGLDSWGTDETYKQKIELESERHPSAELFKVGYFRSSYNSGGIDRILHTNCGGKTLSWIFNVGDDYHVRPDWRASRRRAEEALEDLQNHAARYGGLKIERVDFFGLSKTEVPSDEEEAMALVKKHIETFGEKGKKSFGSYSSREGWFFLDEPRSVVALIPGTQSFLNQTQPCVYAAFKSEDAFSFYCTALEIVIETIDYVLAQPDPESYILHWSG